MSAAPVYQLTFQVNVADIRNIVATSRGRFWFPVLFNSGVATFFMCIGLAITLLVSGRGFGSVPSKLFIFLGVQDLPAIYFAFVFFFAFLEIYTRFDSIKKIRQRIRPDRLNETVILTEDSITTRNTLTEWSTTWAAISKVEDSSDYIVLFVDPLLFLQIPSRAVGTSEEWSALTQFVRKHANAPA
ncbi:YcxB family protein [Prosthecodimorpha staleyi]|uniref:YcxB family protein n=1 Tax=Prosthecodimorpha staleyi TaxID=2840188 RepID=A0A947D772_9HYPH|nr:YcxB family protein [Prosthecodimorpha staleyi]MBT9291623.1 YcxB family protein [Prosthecodimorpha staleyi]